MKTIAPLDSVAFSELMDLCRIDAARAAPAFKANGSFIQETRNGGKQRYWYYRGYARSPDGSPGAATKSYVGPVGDAAIEAIVAAHAEANASYAVRRHLVSRLKRAGLPAPLPMEGAVVEALSSAGILASGSVVVGSVAFQTYGGLLGIRPDQSHYRTLDLDVARPRGIRLQPSDAEPVDVLEALRAVDPAFAPLHHADEPKLVAGFRNAAGFRVEFLTPQAATRGGARRMVALAGLSGVGAQPLKFLEFSLKNPVQSLMLHEAGLIIPVPAPARFAVHKLIVATLRTGSAETISKSLKDVLQAQGLIDGIAHVRDMIALGHAWLEAWGNGPSWRRALREGTLRLSGEHLPKLAAAIDEAATMDGILSPFEGDPDPRQALLRAGSQGGGRSRSTSPL